MVLPKDRFYKTICRKISKSKKSIRQNLKFFQCNVFGEVCLHYIVADSYKK